MSDALYNIWLAMCTKPGSDMPGRLLEVFQTSFDIYRADSSELGAAGVSERQMAPLLNKDLTAAGHALDYCTGNGINVIFRTDLSYPQRLRDIPNPPCVLYVRGDVSTLDAKLIFAMVGTRSMSEYGMRMAYKIAYELSSAGAVVVSGMALGIDGVASCGALAAHGKTVAVLGCGLDRAYPASHAVLMEEIAASGAVISEYAPGTPPAGHNFPVRNRIISGLCLGTLVIEAGEGSGAMITARESIRQGRDIFALPGNIGASNSSGTNALIRDGARIVLDAHDIINEYGLIYGDAIDFTALYLACKHSDFNKRVLDRYGVEAAAATDGTADIRMPFLPDADDKTEEKRTAKAPANPRSSGQTRVVSRDDRSCDESNAAFPSPMSAPVSPPEGKSREIYDMMPEGRAVTVDHFTSLGRPAGEILRILTMLEISGYITSMPGGTFIRHG